MKETKIIIADDHSVVLSGLKAILEEVDWIKVIKTISDLRDVIPNLHYEKADILILDVNMNKMNSLEIVPEIRSKFPELKIINFTSYDLPVIRKEASSVGVDAYLLKDSTKEKIIAEIYKTLNSNKQKIISPLLGSNVLMELDDSFVATEVLSKRELEILKLVAGGITSQSIAEQLHISKHTVQWHRKNILSKLKLKSAAEMIRFAYEKGLM